MAEDAFYAFVGVDVFLDGDFVGSVLFEEAAGADVDAFGVFAEDHEVEIPGGAIAERGEAVVEKFGGAGVDIEIELEAEAEEDVRGMLVGGDTGIAESAEEDGVEFVAEEFDGAFGEGDFLAEIFVGAPIELDEFERAIAFGGGGLDELNGDGSDFFADAVTRDDGDAGFGAAVAMWDVGHLLAPVRVTGVMVA